MAVKPERYHKRRQWLEPTPRPDARSITNPWFKDLPRDQQTQFGNKLFFSSNQSYKENFFRGIAGESRMARLLVSPAGRQLFHAHPGFLGRLDQALLKLNQDQTASVPLDNGNICFSGSSGNQALNYRAQLADVDLKIRTVQSDGVQIDGVIQPLYKEMLQIQMAAHELESQLGALEIELPQYFFSSAQVAGVRFEPGEYPESEEFYQKAYQLAEILKIYIQVKQKQNDPLWSLVRQDITALHHGEELIRYNNFILRDTDQKIVCIDPFLASRSRI